MPERPPRLAHAEASPRILEVDDNPIVASTRNLGYGENPGRRGITKLMTRRRPTKRKAAKRPAARVQRASSGAARNAAGLTAAKELSHLLALLESEGSKVVKTVAGAWRADDPPDTKLTSCLAALMCAFGDGQELRCHLFLRGWAQASTHKRIRLAMAWIREQLRLCVHEILEEGVAAGAFRSDLDPAAFSAIALGAAEGLLLQSSIQGGAVPVEQLTRALQQSILR